MIHTGDCIEVMAGMEPESIDVILTDPPYLLRFMGKSWDGPTQMSGHATPDAGTVGFYQAVGKGGAHDAGMDNWKPNWMQSWHEAWAREAFRVAKPSAYLLAFGGTRTVHRMTAAIEDAGWIIRDMLVWAYASGFPKSKASLKPAWEPIVMARKPGPLRMLAIDECRIPLAGPDDYDFMASRMPAWNRKAEWEGAAAINVGVRSEEPPAGRWPANVILTDPIFDGDTEGVVGGGIASTGGSILGDKEYADIGYHGDLTNRTAFTAYGDEGTYSRFFLIPKARADREPALKPPALKPSYSGGIAGTSGLDERLRTKTERHNQHPTVKPTDLMRHLVRLVTPPGGLVLDPFLGSGTTALAAELEGFPWVGIEKEPEYVAIAEARLNGTQRGMGLSA